MKKIKAPNRCPKCSGCAFDGPTYKPFKLSPSGMFIYEKLEYTCRCGYSISVPCADEEEVRDEE